MNVRNFVRELKAQTEQLLNATHFCLSMLCPQRNRAPLTCKVLLFMKNFGKR